MTLEQTQYVGIDVSMDYLDVALYPLKKVERFENSAFGVVDLSEFLSGYTVEKEGGVLDESQKRLKELVVRRRQLVSFIVQENNRQLLATSAEIKHSLKSVITALRTPGCRWEAQEACLGRRHAETDYYCQPNPQNPTSLARRFSTFHLTLKTVAPGQKTGEAASVVVDANHLVRGSYVPTITCG